MPHRRARGRLGRIGGDMGLPAAALAVVLRLLNKIGLNFIGLSTLGGSWVVVNGVISGVTILISHIRLGDL